MSSNTNFESLPHVDELVMEYLLFRGFTQCFRVFESARRNDRLQFFNVARIVDQLFSFADRYDFKAMSSLWQFLDGRFFAHLDEIHASSVRTFARALQRDYIVNCIASGATQKAIEFFREYGQELNQTSMNGGADWSDWFQLPFLPRPAHDPRFAPYFTTQWRDSLRTSLSNFLSLIFTNVPVPKLLAFNLADIQQNERECMSRSQQSRMAALEGELQQTRAQLRASSDENQNLRAALRARENNEPSRISTTAERKKKCVFFVVRPQQTYLTASGSSRSSRCRLWLPDRWRVSLEALGRVLRLSSAEDLLLLQSEALWSCLVLTRRRRRRREVVVVEEEDKEDKVDDSSSSSSLLHQTDPFLLLPLLLPLPS